jgi:serine protease
MSLRNGCASGSLFSGLVAESESFASEPAKRWYLLGLRILPTRRLRQSRNARCSGFLLFRDLTHHRRLFVFQMRLDGSDKRRWRPSLIQTTSMGRAYGTRKPKPPTTVDSLNPIPEREANDALTFTYCKATFFASDARLIMKLSSHSLAFALLLSLGFTSSVVAVDRLVNEKEVFSSGVFGREAARAVAPLDVIPKRPKLDVYYDREGNSNQLLVLLDFNDRSFLVDTLLGGQTAASRETAPERAQVALEKDLIAAINTRGSSASRYFGSPAYAGYWMLETQMTPEQRALLKPGSPTEKLQRYFLLNFQTIVDARASLERVKSARSVAVATMDQQFKRAAVPNDPYAAQPGDSPVAATYQWGLYRMNFIGSGDAAHDVHRGHGYVAVLDGLGANSATYAPEISANVRRHLSTNDTADDYGRSHGTFVASILAANTNNNVGMAGACPNCSLQFLPGNGSALRNAHLFGVGVANMSFGSPEQSTALDDAIASAAAHDVVMIAASGNENLTQPNYPARNANVLSVGGIQQDGVSGPWPRWSQSPTDGANWAGINGVVAPAKHVIGATRFAGASLLADVPSLSCGDGGAPADISGPQDDGIAACQGTSFATPYVSGLAGLIRSINPRMPRETVYELIRASSGQAKNPELGSGVPNALTAVKSAIARTPNRLTPLFSLWSNARSDYFYTTSPQMAMSAWYGMLLPVNDPSANYISGIGQAIIGYTQFPNDLAVQPLAPAAGAWVFTTPANPVNSALPLLPLYRLSWKCGDGTTRNPVICQHVASHMDTTYASDQAGIDAFTSLGYKLDGIEGYIYPKTVTPPSGAVRLMRKYSPSRDDHAIFPESEAAVYTVLGYTENSGSDWLGYVYPNTNGSVPNIVGGQITISGMLFYKGNPYPTNNGFNVSGGAVCTGVDLLGRYSCEVPYGFTGSIEPIAAGVTFTPSYRSYSNVTSSIPAEDYQGDDTKVTMLILVMTETDNKAVPDVTVTSTGDAVCTKTDATGRAICTVGWGWSGTLSVSEPTWKFRPALREYWNIQTSGYYDGFIASRPIISGTVKRVTGEDVYGVIFPAATGIGPGWCSTKSDGTYRCRVPIGFTGNMIPTKSGCTFTPANRSYTNVRSDIAEQNYVTRNLCR